MLNLILRFAQIVVENFKLTLVLILWSANTVELNILFGVM